MASTNPLHRIYNRSLETIVSAEITDIIAAENNHGHGLPHQTLLHAFHCQGYISFLQESRMCKCQIRSEELGTSQRVGTIIHYLGNLLMSTTLSSKLYALSMPEHADHSVHE
jgi:hypothetical protein